MTESIQEKGLSNYWKENKTMYEIVVEFPSAQTEKGETNDSRADEGKGLASMVG